MNFLSLLVVIHLKLYYFCKVNALSVTFNCDFINQNDGLLLNLKKYRVKHVN